MYFISMIFSFSPPLLWHGLPWHVCALGEDVFEKLTRNLSCMLVWRDYYFARYKPGDANLTSIEQLDADTGAVEGSLKKRSYVDLFDHFSELPLSAEADSVAFPTLFPLHRRLPQPVWHQAKLACCTIRLEAFFVYSVPEHGLVFEYSFAKHGG